MITYYALAFIVCAERLTYETFKVLHKHILIIYSQQVLGMQFLLYQILSILLNAISITEFKKQLFEQYVFSIFSPSYHELTLIY